jgi:ribosome-associated protein
MIMQIVALFLQTLLHNRERLKQFVPVTKNQSIFVTTTDLLLRMTEKNELVESIIEGIQEKKGKNISSIWLKGITGAICEYFVICEGNTPTQVSALADSVEEMVRKKTTEKPIRIHGQQKAEWIAIDYGDVIVHIFLPELRTFYNIDNLWDDAQREAIPSLL